jgi:uncharacterized pyridoxal phosphate-containing UPF0001 family protein
VKYVAGKVALLHSVDSSALLDAIEARGAAQACLVQVNVARRGQQEGRRARRAAGAARSVRGRRSTSAARA